ncbi:MAG: glutamate dehydrogenase, partial [Pseudonocardiales bacterium]|nr:glutamate dehydrogenase [Pseudonocardiales bacterium]
MSSTGTRSRRPGNEQHDEKTNGQDQPEDSRSDTGGDQTGRDSADQDEPDDAGATEGKGRKARSDSRKKAKSGTEPGDGKPKSGATKSASSKSASAKPAAKSAAAKPAAAKSAPAKPAAAKAKREGDATAAAERDSAATGGAERDLVVQAQTAAAPGLAKLSELYFRHTPVEDLAAAAPEQLAAAVRSHYQLAEHRAQGRPVLRVSDGAVELGRSCTVVEIVNDDMPFLVESVLAAISRSGASVQRVMHPIVVVRRGLAGDLLEVLPDADPDDPPEDTQLESWMHVETDSLGDADSRERLSNELSRVLADVREVVEDRDRMRHTARDLAAELRSDPPPLATTEVEDGAQLLEWLADDHFTFLGYRRYELHTGAGDEGTAEEPKLSQVLASGLGVLRGDNLSTQTFAPGTDAVERATARELLLFSQASSPSR